MTLPKFISPADGFHAELKSRVNDYFNKINVYKTGNSRLYTKAIVLAVSFIAVYVHLVFFTTGPAWFNLLECVLLGALTSAIGFNIMHDGAHGSFSSRKWVNELAGLSINFLGANVFMWKTKHNIVHHTFTNIDGVDDDIDAKPFLRLCDTQKHYKVHKYQHIYFLAAYSLLYLYWIFFTDYKKYFSSKVGEVTIKKMSLTDHFTFWGFKAIHLLLFVVLPIYFVGPVAWLAGFLTYGLFAGIVLSVVFQLAHTVKETQFPQADLTTGKTENTWAIHQLKTTANFATRSKFWSWFTGGLNFQVEHHLFPNISHVHYPALSKIVKSVCRKYKIPYLEHRKLRYAFISHVAHLKAMGKRSV